MRLMAIDQPLRDPKIPLVIQPGDNPIRVQMISNCLPGSLWYPKKAPVSLGKSQNCMGTMGRRLADDWRMIVPPKMVGQKTEMIFWDSIKLMQKKYPTRVFTENSFRKRGKNTSGTGGNIYFFC